jgi:hypothetical protein
MDKKRLAITRRERRYIVRLREYARKVGPSLEAGAKVIQSLMQEIKDNTNG